MPRRGRNLRPRDREQKDERFRQDIERTRRAKGLPTLEPTSGRERQEQAPPVETPARLTPARRTPGRSEQEAMRQMTRQFFCPQCQTHKDPLERAGEGSILCRHCARHPVSIGIGPMQLGGMELD